MQLPERYSDSMEGLPGAVVDEDITESGSSYLYYAFFNEKGYLTYYAEFWRSASPRDVADVLNRYADELLDFHPRNMTLVQVLDRVYELRKQARNVPGLEVKGKY